MRSFILRVVINALALWIASWILQGRISVSTSATAGAAANSGITQGADIIGIILAYLFIGLIFGMVNALVKPLVSLLSLPLTILTLGLFTVVINAAMLYLTSWLSAYTPVHFTIDSFFWTAVFAAIIITVISLVAGRLPGGRRR
jgi:putative membrane protein